MRQPQEAVRLVWRENAGVDRGKSLAEFGTCGDRRARVEALTAALLDLIGLQAEDEDVLVSDMVADFDIGAVERADGKRAIERKLHVAGARSLHARGRDLLREVRRRD